MWRQSDTLVKTSKLGEIRMFSFSKNNSCSRSWTQIIGADTLQDSKTIEDWSEAFFGDVEHESRLNKHGATEQPRGTVDDISNKITGSQSCSGETEEDLLVQWDTFHWFCNSGLDFGSWEGFFLIREGGAHSRVHWVLQLNCQGNQQNGDKPQKPSKDSEHFAQIKPYNCLNCRLQLVLSTGRPL